MKLIFILLSTIIFFIIDDILISLIFKHIKLDKNNHNNENNIKTHFNNPSVLIGYAERIIILYLLYNNEITALSVIVAAKAILRRDSNVQNNNNEYITLGTLINIALTIINFIILTKIY